LIVRADQLGDFVSSIPAIMRLRALFPEATFHAVVSASNLALARELDLFAKLHVVEWSYDEAGTRRLMTLASQVALREALRTQMFDLAIDLSPASETRGILRLSGARDMVGFKPSEFPWLTFGIDVVTRDRVNGKERISHAAFVLSLVESLAAVATYQPMQLPGRTDRSSLARFAVADSEYALLHAGARLAIKRWPLSHYLRLAETIIKETKMNVVLLSDDPVDSTQMLTIGLDERRLQVVVGGVRFEELEALVHHCSVYVGNDTGPKHLAAIRGAKVVSIHMNQVNWDEWGQDGTGLIVSRRVPCAGCGIEYADDCGKDLACLTNIRPEEVFAAVQQLRSNMHTPG